jgi:hypothetical protein
MATKYKFDSDNPYESYQTYRDDYRFKDAWEGFEPDYTYTKFSPKDKKRHIRAIEKDLMESGFDWTQQDAILRNERQRWEGLSLFKASGAFIDENNQLNLSKVNTKEKKKMYERAGSILDNLAAKYGGRGTEYENLPWSDLEKEDPSWSNLGEALVGTGKDVGSDLYNLTRHLSSYPLYGIPGINADVKGFLDKYMPWIEGPEKSRYIGSGFRYNEPSVDEDSWLPNFLNQEGGGFLGKSSVPEVNPWKGFANRFRGAGDALALGTMLYLTRGKGIAPLVNKLPNAMKSKIGQVLPFLSGQGSFWPKYGGPATKFAGNKLKYIGQHLKNRKWNPFTTQRSTWRNATFGLPTLGAATAARDVMGQDVSIADTFDRDVGLFDNYMTNKLQNFKPRPTPRHPREMMESANTRGLGNVRGEDELEVTLDVPYGSF